MNITEWEGDIQRDVFDDSHFDGVEGNARTKVGGMAKLVGRCSGWAQVGTTPGIGSLGTEDEVTGGTFNLTADTASSATDLGYTFTGIISDMTVDVIKTGLVAVSFSFESQGVVGPVV